MSTSQNLLTLSSSVFFFKKSWKKIWNQKCACDMKFTVTKQSHLPANPDLSLSSSQKQDKTLTKNIKCLKKAEMSALVWRWWFLLRRFIQADAVTVWALSSTRPLPVHMQTQRSSVWWWRPNECISWAAFAAARLRGLWGNTSHNRVHLQWKGCGKMFPFITKTVCSYSSSLHK